MGEAGVAVVSRRGAERLRRGHVWVYRSDIAALPADAIVEAGAEADAPRLLTVNDTRGVALGTALYSPYSEIALRLISTEVLESEAAWLGLLASRLKAAIEQRQPIFTGTDTDASRLVFSEADGLPGLIVDKYGRLVVVQLLSKALDSVAVRIVVTETLRAALGPEVSVIVERPDPRIRELEKLSADAGSAPLWSAEEEPLLKTVFRLNGLAFHYDAAAGQKTGAFLDQRENYSAAARYAHGEALDVCTYQGGFALHLAQTCSRVTGVDVSHASLEVAESNLGLNPHLKAQVDWMEANAFDLLKDWSEAGTKFDTIVLDPPAFAKSKRAVEGALRGYKEMNLRAMKMLRPGGVLVTNSCSHHVSGAEFQAVVAAAAGDVGRRVRLLERRGAAADHPVVLTIPETEYLKCLVLKVE
ncbi:class I SAM-dependent rRNA methyltransferase [Silvibacterium dinghuense]|uniref:Class I SAM-dependent rRNA methyltransferase n=2 Tax=Silvibacterium dinghuense TaxID=1560006 RepID=A0A4Q1S913_9BACT|nr:class I SAM-dependent rRNA methyltransferase [Silvibacterium dinghuense]